MKIVCISDTHGEHENIHIPHGDVLIHAGDISCYGKEVEVDRFLKWFSKKPHPYKIFIAGNHDFYFEKTSTVIIKDKIPNNVIYLNDSGCTINDFHFWGSPIQPYFHKWAFNRRRGAEIERHWELIPQNTDVLITHGPPYSILDLSVKGQQVGCKDLYNTIKTLKIKAHIFGHIHEDYGRQTTNGIQFVNASILDEFYKVVNSPIIIEI